MIRASMPVMVRVEEAPAGGTDMAYLHSYVENAAVGAAEEIMGAAGDLTIPAGRRAVVHRFDGYTMGATNCVMRLRTTNIAGAIIYGAARAGIGPVGGACFIYVNAIAAAVVLVPTGLNSGGNAISGVALSAFVE